MDDGEEVLDQRKQCAVSDYDGWESEALYFRTDKCTHTHTCNPPSPDAAHTHTCYHTHSQVFTKEEDDGIGSKQHVASKSRRPLGNRVAVCKYKEKKKAQTAGLEDEVKILRAINQQLLQEKVVLVAENSSLKKLLHILKETLNVGLGVCPLNKQASTSLQDCRVPPICATNIPCLHPCVGSSSQAGIGGSMKMNTHIREGICESATVTCQTNGKSTPSAAQMSIHEGYDLLQV